MAVDEEKKRAPPQFRSAAPKLSVAANIFTMSIPSTVITGTIGFLLLCALSIGAVQTSRATGMMSKDNADIGNVIVGIASFSMWLFWLCAWMHQWHPLIKPIYEG